ncbi:MAG: PBP1A family penicillin-binding protein [Deltaproteobacteria bacterium]|nr:PBP1A family penicillin-binding protein [Deltaproteobacteria bacterium]
MARRKKTSFLKRLLKYAFLLLIVVSLGVALYCWDLSLQIDKRFSGRRWSIPSRALSDTTILYPGQGVNRTLLEKKLDRLGYRNSSQNPTKKGDVRISSSRLEIFLNDLKAPQQTREGFPAMVQFSGSRIESIVHSRSGEAIPILELEPEELMRFFGPEREQRQLVSIDHVPRHVVHAVLAAEDSRFFEHRGLDPLGILRALYTNLRSGDIRQGGSTITQQLAKNYFLTPERTWARKVKEAFMALIMEAMYDKKAILEIYLNEIYLGQKESVSINGIGEASTFYFGKSVAELSVSEGAVIAGLIRAPNLFSPYADRNRCRARRDSVLEAMHKHQWLTAEQLRTAMATPLVTSGYEAYVRRAPYFMDYLSHQLGSLYPREALTSLGLSLFTTLDTQVQMAAEDALLKGLKRLEDANPRLKRKDPEKKLQGAIVVMQPKTGYILAMVGGRDYGASQFNRITQAKRQPGSAFKPFVFLPSLDSFTPASILSNEPKTYKINGNEWRPENYIPVPETRISMRDALSKSVNRATVDLAMKLGLDPVVKTASVFGFSTPLKPYPSIALGAFEVVPLELARAYCAFAADGILPVPLSLKEVLDESGKILERRHMSVQGVTTPGKAFLITSMLRSTVEQGTARSLKDMGIRFPAAGKTGTTNEFKDGWFVGYTPEVMALIWVGFDDGTSLQAPASALTLPLWADLMSAIPHHVSGSWFKTPPDIVVETVCKESGQRALASGCPLTLEEYFLAENTPKERCTLHRGLGPLEGVIKGVKDFLKTF